MRSKLFGALAALALVAAPAAAEPPFPPDTNVGFELTIGAPDKFSAGQPITVSGFVYAVVRLPLLVEVAQGVPNIDVELVVDGTIVQKTQTGGGGHYQFEIAFGATEPTTHLIRTMVMRDVPVLEASSLTVATSIDRFVTELEVVPGTATVGVGGTLGLKACALYNDGRSSNVTNIVTWSSSNPGVATVSNADGTRGQLTGVAPGTSTISATIDGATATSDVTVAEGSSSPPAPCPAF